MKIDARHGPNALESDARLIEGPLRTDVTLTLDASAISYRGTGTPASIQLTAIDGIEYDEYLVAGGIPNGTILRLRAGARTLEFILDAATDEWKRRLPAVESIR